MLADVQIVDVRTPEEIMRGKIGNAIEMDYYQPDFEKNIQSLDTTKTIVLYCRSGRRSADAAEICIKNGFKDVYNVIGGFDRYTAIVGK